jgi:ribonuclease H-related protein
MKVYVVTAPEDRRGLYETWEACKAAVHGVAGARYQSVASRAEAEAILGGEGVTLGPGLYAFVDGNHQGGVGVVLVSKSADGSPTVLREIGTTVQEVFGRAGIETLESPDGIARALARIRNVLAELGGLYAALGLVPSGAAVTIVHDYEGVAAWVTGRWRAKDPTVAQVVAACRGRIAERRLDVSFRHQRGHQSVHAGVNEFAAFNRRADALAAQASGPPRRRRAGS